MTNPTSAEVLDQLLDGARGFTQNAMAGNLFAGTCYFPADKLSRLTDSDQEAFHLQFPNIKLVPHHQEADQITKMGLEQLKERPMTETPYEVLTDFICFGPFITPSDDIYIVRILTNTLKPVIVQFNSFNNHPVIIKNIAEYEQAKRDARIDFSMMGNCDHLKLVFDASYGLR